MHFFIEISDDLRKGDNIYRSHVMRSLIELSKDPIGLESQGN